MFFHLVLKIGNIVIYLLLPQRIRRISMQSISIHACSKFCQGEFSVILDQLICFHLYLLEGCNPMKSVWGRQKIGSPKHNFRSQRKNIPLALSNPQSLQTKNSSQYSTLQLKMSQRFSKSSAEGQNKKRKLLSLSIRRVVNRKLCLLFRKLKEHRTSNFTLTLLASKKQRLMAQVFSNIRNYLNQKSAIRVQGHLNSKKKSQFLFYVLSRSLKKTQKLSFLKIKCHAQRQYSIKKFAKILETIISQNWIKHQKKQVWREMIKKISAGATQKQQTRKIYNILAQNMQKKYNESFKTLVKYYYGVQMEKIKQSKKEVNGKMAVYSSKKVKEIMNEKQKVWGMKQNLDSESTEKNKIKNDMMRNANILKNKAKEENKKAMKMIRQLERKKEGLERNLNSLAEKNTKTQRSLNTVMREDDVQQLYQQVYDENCNEQGHLKPGFFKQHRLKLKTELFPYQTYHMYKNQRLKQEIMVHQKQKKYKDRQKTVSQGLIWDENQTLMEIIKLTLRRKLESFIIPPIVEM